VLLALGLGIRAVVGPGPAVGWRVNRALAAARAGQPEAARLQLQALVEEHAREPYAWFRAGRALREAGHPSEASLYLTKAAELDSTSSTIRYELAKSLLAEGMPGDAGRAVGDLLTLDDGHADGLYLGAAIAASRRDVESAAVLLERALREGPSDPDRFRWDPLFDPVRNEPRVLSIVYAWRVPGALLPERERGLT
jgi:tetratricopeptide (TPR) repeat protein